MQHSRVTELLLQTCLWRKIQEAAAKAALTMITSWCSAARKKSIGINQPTANVVRVTAVAMTKSQEEIF